MVDLAEVLFEENENARDDLETLKDQGKLV